MFFFFFFNDQEYKPGMVCRVVRGWEKDKKVVIHQVRSHPDGLSLWCYENKPVTYRINGKGNKVIEFDPACVMSPYSPSDLEITAEVPLQTDGWGAMYRH